ncbi:MAG: hypothetical protein O2958_05900 [Gemmatimonadetes bacterium]|nr:hypothetical protein [Gemmatimonadota bacterium]
MSESLDQEIRTLQSLFWSERDPEGLAFAPLADAFLRKGNVKEALDLLTDGTSRHPGYATGHVVATRLYFANGMHSEAEFAARRSIELDAENIVALSTLAAVLTDRGEAEQAARFCDALVGADPESEEAKLATSAVAAAPEAATSPAVDATSAAGDLGMGLDVADDWAESAVPPEAEVLPAAEMEVDDFLLAVPDVDMSPLDGLAPVEMDLGSLEAVPELEAMDLSAFAPDPEPEPQPEVMDLSAFAPDPEPEPEPEVMDLSAFAPDPEPEPEAMDLSALAPDPEVMDLSAFAPDDVLDLSDRSPDPVVEDSEMGSTEPVYTRTLAELYVKQGFEDRALHVLRHLLSEDPAADDIRNRIEVLEGGSSQAPPVGVDEDVDPAEAVTLELPAIGAAPVAPSEKGDVSDSYEEETEEEVETLARDLAESGRDAHDVDTPFAWTETETTPSTEGLGGGPGIGSYFDDLLAWESRGES